MPNWWDSAPKINPFDVALSAENVTGPLADLARSIYTQESSGGRNTKTSNAGAVGGMQILPGTFKGVADSGWDINDPIQNARAGIRYAKQMLDQAGGNVALAAAGYYGGPGGLEKARKGIAVSDPRNPNAPNTLEYGQQVASRVPGKQPAAPSGDWWASAPVVDATEAPAPAQEVATQTPKRDRTTAEKIIAAAGYANPAGLALQGITDGNFSIGAARGLKDVVDTGAELLARGYDKVTGGGPKVSDLVTGQPSGEAARVAAMNQQGKQDFANTYGNSTGANVGRIAGNVVATYPVGGLVAAPLRFGATAIAGSAPGAANVLARLASAAQTGGMTVGPGGSAASNMLLRVLGGAGTGGASAALVDPNAASFGALVGGALPPAMRLAGAAGGAISGVSRSARDIMTRAGQERIASNILQRSATDPVRAAENLAAARSVVPGSNPTIGQAAQDPGLAQLERTLVNNPETAAALQARYAQQRAARSGAIDEVAATTPGSGSYYDDVVEGRRIFANEDYARARAQGVDPEMAASMQAEISSLLERPSIRTAINDARRLAAETGETINDFGSVQGLDWVKKALDNQISKATNGPTSSIGAEDLRALMQTRSDLNATLEQLAPAYREANRNYAAMSTQINGMDVARAVDQAYSPVAGNFGLSAKEHGHAYMKALRRAQDSVRPATGQNLDIGQTLSTADIHALENVARDLARKEYSETAGRAVGSPTAQNMLSQYLVDRVLADAGLPSGAANSTLLNSLLRPVEFAGKLAAPKVTNRLAELALSPEEAALALRTIQATRPRGLSMTAPMAELAYRSLPLTGAQ
ncbi:lytic transglycosylase domain-containing protein [Variovorax sp. UC122_21]|uniref:lytic transglycosylase domain-containing protein n=1 Tax=Variovorax sp. UC122_21 TaxID=3374554 RepID=UPI003757BFE2